MVLVDKMQWVLFQGLFFFFFPLFLGEGREVWIWVVHAVIMAFTIRIPIFVEQEAWFRTLAPSQDSFLPLFHLHPLSLQSFLLILGRKLFKSNDNQLVRKTIAPFIVFLCCTLFVPMILHNILELREVEDFARRLNSDWPERMQEILSLGQERRPVHFFH